MTTVYPCDADGGNEEVVRVPRPADALGAALRGVFGAGALPTEWLRLLGRIDRPR